MYLIVNRNIYYRKELYLWSYLKITFLVHVFVHAVHMLTDVIEVNALNCSYLSCLPK